MFFAIFKKPVFFIQGLKMKVKIHQSFEQKENE